MPDVTEKRMTDYKEAFRRLQDIVYRDIYINGACFRILAINLLDYGLDWSVKKHKHTFFECCYITENTTYLTVNQKEYFLEPGEFYVIPPGTFHSHRQEKGTSHIGFGLRWEIVGLNEEKFDNTFRGIDRVCDKALPVFSSPKSDEEFSVLSGMLRLLTMADDKCGKLELQMEFLQLVLLISDAYCEQERDRPYHIEGSFVENSVIASAVRFMEENYAQTIDADDIAQFVYLSYSQLYRLFKKQLGESVNGYLIKLRIGKAQKLLLCSDKSVDRIAGETGFHSEQYFCRAFKKQCGMSPKAYRTAKAQLSE